MVSEYVWMRRAGLTCARAVRHPGTVICVLLCRSAALMSLCLYCLQLLYRCEHCVLLIGHYYEMLYCAVVRSAACCAYLRPAVRLALLLAAVLRCCLLYCSV